MVRSGNPSMRARSGVVTPISALPPIRRSTESSSAAMEEKTVKRGIEAKGAIVARRAPSRDMECGATALNKRGPAPKIGISASCACLYKDRFPVKRRLPMEAEAYSNGEPTLDPRQLADEAGRAVAGL